MPYYYLKCTEEKVNNIADLFSQMKVNEQDMPSPVRSWYNKDTKLEVKYIPDIANRPLLVNSPHSFRDPSVRGILTELSAITQSEVIEYKNNTFVKVDITS